MTVRRVPVSRRERPAKPALSREGIVTVALRILREEGLERVTMRRLAQELDTGPASLYVYVSNMAELHGALLDELLAELDLTPSGDAGAWRDELVGLLTAYTKVLFRHPSLARSLLVLRPTGRHYLRLVEAVLALLRTGGVTVRQAAWGVDILLQHATASAAEHGTRDESATADAENEALERALHGAPADEHPHIAWASGELFTGTGEERLRWGFLTLIDGLAS
ncbi:TetR/AcrR family transcriptional regulator [Actinoplanes sp. NPDC049548]|uniref:TetR/AcrR family transcriptional regulator n=1 Tax=Actinoplanes sp. NPDC049548 TaxID=3155152 RepID=UPI0034372D01